LSRDPGVQAEPGHFHDLGESVIFFPGRNGLQREHLTPLLRTDGNAITDRATQYPPHRVFVTLFQVQITVFFIAFEDALSLQKPGKFVLILQNRIFISQQFWESVNMFRTVKTILVVLAVLISSIASADLAIIAHPDYDGGELNEDIVRKLFLRENTAFPSGHTAIPANHAIGSPDRKDFFKYVMQMGEVRYKRHWSRKVSTGKKGAPEELSNYSDVLKWVSNTPLSIAYIDKNMVNDSVKVLMTVYVFDDI
jgi:hypothetical protein